MSAKKRGENHPMYGKKVPPEIVEKRIAPQRGQSRPSIKGENNPAKRPEVRAKISENNSMRYPEVRERFQGENHPMYGRHHSPESIALMSTNRKGKATGGRNGTKRPEVQEKIRQAKLGTPRPDMAGENNPMRTPEIAARVAAIAREWMNRPDVKERYSGENHWNWQGGISPNPQYCEKWTAEFRERIRAYFGNECIICGKSTEDNGRKLHCHHVNYNKDACCDDSPTLFAPLCTSHHMQTNANRERWAHILSYIIWEVYGGKSFLTKDEYALIKASK